jgi:hypothetical protein
MRTLFCVLAALSLSLSPASAQSNNVEIPTEFKQFFEEYSALVRKYPAAAERFGITDRKPLSTPSIRSSGCGVNWCCTESHDSGGTMVCDKCSFCPK